MDEENEVAIQHSWISRTSQRLIEILNYKNWTSKAENSYLSILRYVALLGATILVIIAINLGNCKTQLRVMNKPCKFIIQI